MIPLLVLAGLVLVGACFEYDIVGEIITKIASALTSSIMVGMIYLIAAVFIHLIFGVSCFLGFKYLILAFTCAGITSCIIAFDFTSLSFLADRSKFITMILNSLILSYHVVHEEFASPTASFVAVVLIIATSIVPCSLLLDF